MNKQTLTIGLLIILLSGGVVFAMTFDDQNKENTDNKDSHSANVVSESLGEKATTGEPVSDTSIEKDGSSENSDQKATSSQSTESTSDSVTVYFFWGDGCPHCAKEKPFLEQMEEKYSELEVEMFEVYYSQENQELFKEVAQAYGTQARGVPATFVGGFDPIVGFGSVETTGQEIENKIKQCIEDGCISPEEKL